MHRSCLTCLSRLEVPGFTFYTPRKSITDGTPNRSRKKTCLCAMLQIDLPYATYSVYYMRIFHTFYSPRNLRPFQHILLRNIHSYTCLTYYELMRHTEKVKKKLLIGVVDGGSRLCCGSYPPRPSLESRSLENTFRFGTCTPPLVYKCTWGRDNFQSDSV